jgi:predicted GIY-YIG superfamily endonuclease
MARFILASLSRRAYEHCEGLIKGFTSTYGCKRLVWYEYYDLMTDAITREKQIKPDWNDLYDTLA